MVVINNGEIMVKYVLILIMKEWTFANILVFLKKTNLSKIVSYVVLLLLTF